MRPGEAGFDEAVNIWNAAITRRPSVVASCASASDVAQALSFAHRAGLEVSVRRAVITMPASHSPRVACWST